MKPTHFKRATKQPCCGGVISITFCWNCSNIQYDWQCNLPWLKCSKTWQDRHLEIWNWDLTTLAVIMTIITITAPALTLISTAKYGGETPWAGAIITVSILLSPIALPHLKKTARKLMVRVFSVCSTTTLPCSLLPNYILCRTCLLWVFLYL